MEPEVEEEGFLVVKCGVELEPGLEVEVPEIPTEVGVVEELMEEDSGSDSSVAGAEDASETPPEPGSGVEESECSSWWEWPAWLSRFSGGAFV